MAKSIVIKQICATLLLFAVLVYPGHAVDLSQPWNSPNKNKNKAYCDLRNDVSSNGIIGYAVVKDGELIIEDYGETGDPNKKYPLFSVTKSLTSMIIGRMYTIGLVDESTTLGEIFNQTLDWVNVTQASEKQAIALGPLISFTSGLTEPGYFLGFEEANDVLNYLVYKPGLINEVSYDLPNQTYLSTSPILSWVIYRRTGQTPVQFATAQGMFSRLAIDESEFEWLQSGPVEIGAYGLFMNVRQMTKLGQLYLQNGDPQDGGGPLISSDWVDKSTRTTYDEDGFFGYQWLVCTWCSPSRYLTEGLFGQYIIVIPERNVVIASLRLDRDEQDVNACNKPMSEFTNKIIRTHLDDLDVPVDGCTSGLFDRLSSWSSNGVGVFQSLYSALLSDP